MKIDATTILKNTDIAEADTLEKLEQLLPWNAALVCVSKKVVQYA
ncbi:MAG: hypothetical protein WD772_11205 [Pseudohongiellaceae bacterium]